MAPQGPRFEIWQVGGRIHSVDSPVRLHVLRLLERRPRRLTELATLTRKSKSTLSSLHVASLLRDGLVEEVPDDRDARAKLLQLRGVRLGSSAVAAPQLRDAVLAYAQSAGVVPLPAVLHLVDPLGLVQSGAHAAHVEAVAARIGRALGRTIASDDPGRATHELDQVLSAAGVASVHRGRDGRTRVLAREPKLQRFFHRLASEALQARLGGRVRLAGDATG